jgi:hypothetical protein
MKKAMTTFASFPLHHSQSTSYLAAHTVTYADEKVSEHKLRNKHIDSFIRASEIKA